MNLCRCVLDFLHEKMYTCSRGDDQMAMNDNICNFPPKAAPSRDLDILNFVYERRCEFPDKYIIEAAYALRLVTSGSGYLSTPNAKYQLKKGDLFFTFQAKPFKIRNEEGLEYIYISFVGKRADELLLRLNINKAQPVFEGKEALIPLWENSVCSVTESNIDLMAEGLLLFTLSDLCDVPVTSKEKEKRPAEIIKEYVDAHYSESDLTLDSVSKQHSYGKKYISEAFKRHTGMGFSVYLSKLRLNHAVRMMNAGFTSIKEIASFSGFSDPLYFSKVFKKYYGMPPGEYMEKEVKK